LSVKKLSPKSALHGFLRPPVAGCFRSPTPLSLFLLFFLAPILAFHPRSQERLSRLAGFRGLDLDGRFSTDFIRNPRRTVRQAFRPADDLGVRVPGIPTHQALEALHTVGIITPTIPRVKRGEDFMKGS